MEKGSFHLLKIGLLLSIIFLSSAFKMLAEFEGTLMENEPEPNLKTAAFQILDTKCNVCHKKKNPFRIFSLKNMDKHAPRIYQQVFVYKRMPKGNEVQLTEREYQTLNNWLKSNNIF